MKASGLVSSKRAVGLAAAVILGAVLLLFFWRSFVPGQVLFSNDNPLGIHKNACVQFPGSVLGMWFDIYVLGASAGAWPPSLSIFLRGLLGPFGYAKFIVPLTLALGAMCAWYFFRRRGSTVLAGLLGTLAFALNSDYFSTACWGVSSQVVGFGMSYLALGLVAGDAGSMRRVACWSRYALAGLAVGMGVMEGIDNGALFSLMVAGFVVYDALMQQGPPLSRLGRGFGRTAVIAIFAFFVAFQMVVALVSTQIQGIVGTEQDRRTKDEHWNWATQWSLPKSEALDVIVPGLFGYRMDTPQGLPPSMEAGYRGGNYWGRVGSDPTYDDYFAHLGQRSLPTAGFIRFRGSANYLGVPVVLVALWAALQALRRRDSVFDPCRRRFLWFWIAVALASLLLAFGRFAPFYRFLYALPYFSTIRNPIKFMHLFTFALLILFTYGVDGLWRRYLAVPAEGPASLAAALKSCWKGIRGFDRRWIIGCGVALGGSLAAWLAYAHCRPALEHYLRLAEFDDATLARTMASFSIRQVGWFVLSFSLSSVLMFLILSRVLAGSRAKWGGLLLGLLLVADLWRANLPWVIYWDSAQKYATNPVIERLGDKPFEHRVAFLPLRGSSEGDLFDQVYHIEWAQHQFPFYNIQSLDIVQLPRMPADLAAFEEAFQCDGSAAQLYRMTRRWQLTNTRFFLGPAGSLSFLNTQFDPLAHRFHIVVSFDLAAKRGVAHPSLLEHFTAVPNPLGQFALFEFDGALPRAKLYNDWQVPADDPSAVAQLAPASLSATELNRLRQVGTNDFLTLKKLATASFDPDRTVLLAPSPPVPAPASPPAGDPGTVECTAYAPKHIVLQSQAGGPSVLLLNDKYDPDWKVTVDGKAAPMLRCNFIMRGVYLPAGAHTIEFRFQPSIKPLLVSLAGIGLGVVLAGFLALEGRRAGEG
jgi:hypothetical protein